MIFCLKMTYLHYVIDSDCVVLFHKKIIFDLSRNYITEKRLMVGNLKAYCFFFRLNDVVTPLWHMPYQQQLEVCFIELQHNFDGGF